MTRNIDKPLFWGTMILVIGGFLILGSASIAVSQKNFGTFYYYPLRQFITGILPGIIAFGITMHINYRVWKKFAVPFMIFSFILLALLFLPEISYSTGGATRWLKFGPISFQPSEIMKLSFIIYLASWLDARRKEVGSVSYGMIPFAIMLAAVSVFLIMQPDIGTLGVIVGTAVLLYFLGGGKISQVSTLILFGVAVFYFLVQFVPYRIHRILVFLNPSLDPQGIGYQINQAFIAIGSGGFWGTGFGRGLQKYSYLPEPIGDSIFAVYAEEMGFLGVMLMLSLFAFLFWRGMAIAKSAPDMFGRLLAGGISIGIMVQAFINMAAISGLLPLTGIALPFISYGGTSLVVTLAASGILLNISKYT